MLDAQQAKSIVLRHCEGNSQSPAREPFAIQSCELSEQGEYWIVRANSEDYVLHGRGEHCYVGVNAHLVAVESGKIETVGSGQSVDQYLQDKHDIRKAGSSSYVLKPVFEHTDKAAIIRLRQSLECSMQIALQLVTPEFRNWFTGRRRVLQDIQVLLERGGVTTSIDLQPDPGHAIEVDDRAWNEGRLKAALKDKLT
jgi:hypothetical protein